MGAEVAVIVVNWNGWRDTIECIQSLKNLDYSNFRIIVVDNCSNNESVREISCQHPEVTLIRAPRNLGFAGGNNLGILHALESDPKYLWLLNNDTVVVPHALRALVELADGHPGHHFYGSWITFYSRPDRVWFGGGVYRPLTGYISVAHFGDRVADCPSPGASYETDWITGCSLLVRAASIREIGLMDDSFFLYREEVEWQLRRAPRHPRAMMLGEGLVRHKVGASTGTTRSYLGRLFMSRNFIKLSLKYAGYSFPLWILSWLFENIMVPSIKFDGAAIAASIQSLFSLRTPGEELVRSITGEIKPRAMGQALVEDSASPAG
jgi:GT2 family glycosyltransferase